MPYIFKFGNKEIKIPKFEELTWSKIASKPSTFPPSTHNHAWGDVTGKPSTFAPSSHTHDDRYYTETEINAKIGDSGWVNCTLGNGISQYGSGHPAAQVRKIGNIVFLRGIVTNSTTWTTHDSIITIPSGFRPAYSVDIVQQGSGSNRFNLIVSVSGPCKAERYSNNTTISNTVPLNSWLNLYGSWLVG